MELKVFFLEKIIRVTNSLNFFRGVSIGEQKSENRSINNNFQKANVETALFYDFSIETQNNPTCDVCVMWA